ncbi:MAG: hypothetical protein QXS20_06235 [Candidatus Thorarchaeota archaeon]
MRNILAGLAGILWGSLVLTSALPVQGPDMLVHCPATTILFGVSRLCCSTTWTSNAQETVFFVTAWVIVGVFAGLFSRPGWNLVRTVLWAALLVAIAAISTQLMVDASFWTSAERNMIILSITFSSLSPSPVALMSALPVTVMLKRLRRRQERPLPAIIETVCECGARFKSNPVICSVCGRTLRDETT